jgi:hypothetical protein
MTAVVCVMELLLVGRMSVVMEEVGLQMIEPVGAQVGR